MEASDGRSADRISDHSASGGKLLLPTFPGENPSELELRRWADASKDRLRASKLLSFALAAAPTASSDYTERSLIPTPAQGTDASILNAVLGKNLGITADNTDRRTSWANRVRDKSDSIAAALAESMRTTAPGRFKLLEAKHVLGPPHEHMLNGGAMFREVIALLGTMDVEGEAKLAKSQAEWFASPAGRLGDNVSQNQFDARVNEFDVHVNPALKMQYIGSNYVEYLLDNCMPPCLETEARLLRREIEAAGKMADEAHARAEIKKMIGRAHKPDLAPPVVPSLRATIMSMRPAPKAPKAPALGGPVAAAGQVPQSGRKRDSKKEGAGGGNKAARNRSKKLPDGETCKSGTCDNNHGDSPCFRDPNYEGPLPHWVGPDAVIKILESREEVGKRLGKPVKKLKPQQPRPAAPVVPAGADASADQQSAMDQAFAQQRALFPVVRRNEGSAAERAQVSDDECESAHEEDDDTERVVNWYAVIGGPSEGVYSVPATPAAYDLRIRPMVDGQPNVKSYGPRSGVNSEAAAQRVVNQAKQQRALAKPPSDKPPSGSPRTCDEALKETCDEVAQAALNAAAAEVAANRAKWDQGQYVPGWEQMLADDKAKAAAAEARAPPRESSSTWTGSPPRTHRPDDTPPRSRPAGANAGYPTSAEHPSWSDPAAIEADKPCAHEVDRESPARAELREALLDLYCASDSAIDPTGSGRPPPMTGRVTARAGNFSVTGCEHAGGRIGPSRLLLKGPEGRVALFIKANVGEDVKSKRARYTPQPVKNETAVLRVRKALGTVMEAVEAAGPDPDEPYGTSRPSVDSYEHLNEYLMCDAALTVEDDFRWAHATSLSQPYRRVAGVVLSHQVATLVRGSAGACLLLLAAGLCTYAASVASSAVLSADDGIGAFTFGTLTLARLFTTGTALDTLRSAAGGDAGPPMAGGADVDQRADLQLLGWMAPIAFWLMAALMLKRTLMAVVRRARRAIVNSFDPMGLLISVLALMTVYLFVALDTTAFASKTDALQAVGHRLQRADRVLNHLPAVAGARTKFLVNELVRHEHGISSLGLMDDATAKEWKADLYGPPMIGGVGRDKQSKVMLASSQGSLTLADSGAFTHVLTVIDVKRYAPKAKWRPNTEAVSTANGVVTPGWCCDVALPVRQRGGEIRILHLSSALIMEKCHHNLVSIGRLARENGVSTLISPEGTSFIFPDGQEAPLINDGTIIVPDASMPIAPVVQGAHTAVDAELVHPSFNHRPRALLRKMPGCSNAPAAWGKIADKACDHCLRARSDKQTSKNHVKDVKECGHWSVDIYSIGVPNVHGGHKYVFGAHDRKSTLNWMCLMHKKSDSGTCLRKLVAFSRLHGIPMRSLHGDNDTTFAGNNTEFQKVVTEEKIAFTTCAPNEPRGNGLMERQWRVVGDDMRACLNASNLPRTYAAYALMCSVRTSWLLPHAKIEGTTPWEVLTGERAKVDGVRPFGCVAYAKIVNPHTKASDKGLLTVYLGPAWDQPGFICYDPQTKVRIVTPHVKFVSAECPGLTLNKDNYESVVPSFHADFVQNAPLVVDEDADPRERHLLDESADLIDPLLDPVDPPAADGEGSDHGDPPDTEDGHVSSRLRDRGARPFRSVGSLGRAPQGPFLLYLCSGKLWEHDIASHFLKQSSVTVVFIDLDVGGYAHDLTTDSVRQELVAMAKLEHCIGVLFTPPCATWSAMRYVPKKGCTLGDVVRDLDHLDGIRNEKGEIPISVQRADAIVSTGLAVIRAAQSGGKPWIIENPVSRANDSPFRIVGRERHACLFDHPPVVRLASELDGLSVIFDQGALGADSQKTTQLLCSSNIHMAVLKRFGPAHRNPGPADVSLFETSASGAARSSEAARFPSEMNKLLVESFLDPSTDESAPWLNRIAAAVRPHHHPSVVAAALEASADLGGSSIDEASETDLMHAIGRMAAELDQPEITRPMLRRLCPLMSALMLGDTHSSASIGNAFAVSKARQGDDDNPSYRAAMKGPERSFWLDACDAEIDNLTRHQAYVEVPEDSLASWDGNNAAEVINILWVLKKKYDELHALIKGKARAVLDGRMQKRQSEKLNHAFETFAPTVRHSTWRTLCAASRALHKKKGRGKKRTFTFDVEGAYLQGEYAEETQVYARPPPGYRSHDRRGVPIVWRLSAPLYGEADAGRLWNRTFHKQMIVQKFKQSDADPCYYYKVYDDGSRVDICMYVDDGWVETDSTTFVDADMEILAEKFNMEFDDNPKKFLGMNTNCRDDGCLEISAKSYIEGTADKYLPDWRSRKILLVPADRKLRDAYEVALLRENVPDPALVTSYSGKVGAMIYASPCARIDIAQSVALLARALTFPTPELDALADNVMLYMVQTAELAMIIDGDAKDAGTLIAESDSDWSVGHSTTGFCLLLSGIAIVYSSKRQPCIALSSTEAEIIAASACACEVAFVRALLSEMGLHQDAPTILRVDNSGAVELARDRKSCHRSRHVDRRYFKVREFEALEIVKVEHVPTALNRADMLTKAVDVETFVRHRSSLMNVQG